MSFHKTVLQVTILSDGPYNSEDLEVVAYDMLNGGVSGKVETISSEEVAPSDMARLLIAQDSAPYFFGGVEEGEDGYPSLQWVRDKLKLPEAVAYGMQQPGHGTTVVGVVGLAKNKTVKWIGRTLKLIPVNGKPEADPDFGEPLTLR